MKIDKLYSLARSGISYDEFLQAVKSELTGEPITTEINCEIIISYEK